MKSDDYKKGWYDGYQAAKNGGGAGGYYGGYDRYPTGGAGGGKTEYAGSVFKATTCAVCGIACFTDLSGKPKLTGYVCARNDCPTVVTC